MPDFFILSQGLRGPEGAIYHGEPPRLHTGEANGCRIESGALVIYGPKPIPPALHGAPINTLMMAWRAEVRRERKALS